MKRCERRYLNRIRKLPNDRTCPSCGEVKISSRQWVIRDGVAMCLSCYRLSRVQGSK